MHGLGKKKSSERNVSIFSFLLLQNMAICFLNIMNKLNKRKLICLFSSSHENDYDGVLAMVKMSSKLNLFSNAQTISK